MSDIWDQLNTAPAASQAPQATQAQPTQDIWSGLDHAPAPQLSDLNYASVNAKKVPVPAQEESDEEKANEYGSEAGPGFLLENPNFLRGLERGAVRTYLGMTGAHPNHPEATEQEVENITGNTGRGTPEDIAGQMFGGFLAPQPAGLMESGPAQNVMKGLPPGGPKFDVSDPVGAAAQAESERIAATQAKGQAAGLDLPQGGSVARNAAAAAKNQTVSNELVRQDLNLPKGTPLSPDTLDAARLKNASPGYQAIDAYPEPIPLNNEYQATYQDVEHLLPRSITSKLPTDGNITGQQATHWYSILTDKANQFSHMQGATGAGETYSDVAQAYRSLANTLYDSVNEHLTSRGLPDMAQGWRDAATYWAKSKAIQASLDGAGNVNVAGPIRQAFLKSIRGKGPQLSGNTAMLAELAAQNPRAFTLVPGAETQGGALGRIGKAAAPWLGTAVGAAVGKYLGMPTTGAVGGRIAGEQVQQSMEGK